VNLFNEIRKMSLASQDAEEEKKKQSGSPGGGGGGGQSSAGKNKSRRGRRKRRREEEYTDKDRAAAVTLGSRDIKQSLKAKKKRERKMRLSIDFLSSEEYLSSLLVIEASYQLKVKGQPNAALATLNKVFIVRLQMVLIEGHWQCPFLISILYLIDDLNYIHLYIL